MIQEFSRYGLAKMRLLTGVLQVFGALGLIAGFYVPFLTLLASLGLGILMFMGVIVRLRIRDSLLQTSPALFFCMLNFFIFWHSLEL